MKTNELDSNWRRELLPMDGLGVENPSIPHILFGFRRADVYISAESGADGNRYFAAPTLLDLQRRPASLSLGHVIR
jgi:hypothetical protein